MNILNNITSKRILAIGDIMLDIYLDGDVKRISPEAPVPVFRKKTEWNVLGGVANVAANLVAAGQNVSLMTVIGKDENGEKIKKILLEKGINIDFVISMHRNTTTKTRFLANNNQQILRLDIEDTNNIGNSNILYVKNILENEICKFDLVVLSDYMKGFLNYDLTQGILQMAKRKGIPVIVDVKEASISKYRGAYLLKPNLLELRNLTKMRVETNKEIAQASEYLRKKSESKYVLTTCGARGMVLVGEDKPYFIEAVDREVFDVTGAGDTAIAYLAACIANGRDIKEAMKISNYAAGIQVSKVGTSVVYWEDIQNCLMDYVERNIHKMLEGEAIDKFRERYRNKKIVFTNGCFDILHIGHIRYLQTAAKLGDILVIGLNSDTSIKRLKGSERPVNSQMERAEVLCALGFVDYVVIFEEDTPLNIINRIQPDILVKGSDYENKYVVGTREVEKRGGRLELVPFVKGQSTTNIIRKIRQRTTE